MASSETPASGQPGGPARAPGVPDDWTIASRVQAAWHARGLPVVDPVLTREMAVVAVAVVFNAVTEAGYLA